MSLYQSETSECLPEFAASLTDDHPIRVYFEENHHIRGILNELEQTDAGSESQKFYNLFNQLSEVEKRYARKENQLFPYLEKRGWDGPSRGMWAFHDAIRDLLRDVRRKLEARVLDGINEDFRVIHGEMQRLMLIEESRLFPISLQLLTPEDWSEMRAGEEEIGWMIDSKRVRGPNRAKSDQRAPEIEGKLRLEEGALTPEQVNLLLKVIPFDVTYVDENDRVLFYNRGEERVFPRSPGVIGREVRFCHPPKSVGTVLRILEAFRSGARSEAEFWIRFRGRVIHIRYFAVRDAEKKYRGVVEVSQDITEIQKLEGEQRLLSWDESDENATEQ